MIFFKNSSNKEKKNASQISQLKEILKYYKNFLFETKKEDIEIIENAIKNEVSDINVDNYLKDYEEAKKYNERYNIIVYLLESKNKEKTEDEFANAIKELNLFEKVINDKRTKKLRKDYKKILFEYFNDINNKEYILKIFNKESIESFINEMELVKKLNEILLYYKNYFFESKKEDIASINQEIIDLKGNINYDKYLADYDTAKEMNERYDIIKFIADSKNKDNELITEKKINEIKESWKVFEKIIRDKKTNKLKRDDKIIIFKYFSDKDKKEKILKIFNNECYQFILENLNKKEKVDKGKKINIDSNKLNHLKEILKYYNNYLFETKKEDINLIENFLNKIMNINLLKKRLKKRMKYFL